MTLMLSKGGAYNPDKIAFPASHLFTNDKYIDKLECLGRIDSIDAELSNAMKDAGCAGIHFGSSYTMSDLMPVYLKSSLVNCFSG